MKLTIKERLLLLSVLPKKGSEPLARLRTALSFSEAEIVACGITDAPSGTTWNPAVPQEKEILVSPRGVSEIQNTLERTHIMGEFTEELIPLWDRFCGV